MDFGDDFLDIEVPADCEILSMPSMPCLVDSGAEITQALNQPIGSPTLSEIIHSKGKPADRPYGLHHGIGYNPTGAL